MSDHLTPGPDARARIQALGEKTLLEFFGELPPDAMQQVARFLPSVDGFRKTSAAGIAKQKEAVARKLSRTGAGDRDYHSLYVIWRTWIDAKFPNAELANELIDKIEEAADEAKSPDDRRSVIEKHVDSMFETLKDESQQNKCTREQIERLFTFSAFPETAAVRGLIAAAKPASEVDRDAELNDLPQRLRHDEREIQSIKAEMKSLSDRLDPLARSVQAASAKLPLLESKLTSAEAAAATLRSELRQEIKEAQRNEAAQSERARVATDTRLQAISNRVDDLSKELGKAVASLSALGELREAVDRAASDQKASAENLQNHLNRIEKLSAELAHIQQNIAAINNDRTLADRISGLDERLLELEQRRSVDLPAAPSPQTEEPATYSGTKCLVPGNRGALYRDLRRDELWGKFFTAAPQRLRQSVEQYRIVKRA